MTTLLRLRDDVEVTEVGEKGYLLRRSGLSGYTKMGRGFASLMPLFRRGCGREELRTVLVESGHEPRAAELSADRIALSLEEAGLLVGSNGRPQRRKGDLEWESERAAQLLRNMAPHLPAGRLSILLLSAMGVAAIVLLHGVLLLTDPPRWTLSGAAGGIAAAGLALLVASWFVVHEAMHGFVALRNGCRVRSLGLRLQRSRRLSLFPFCRLHEEDVLFDPGAHIRILAAGPAVDLAFATLVVGAVAFAPALFAGSGAMFVAVAVGLVLVNTNRWTKSDLRDIAGILRRQGGGGPFTALGLRLATLLNLTLAGALLYYFASPWFRPS
jgi:hypothetical protein